MAWKQAQAEGSRGADGVSRPTVSALLNTLQEGKKQSRRETTARKETRRSVGSLQSSASGPIKGSSEIY